MYFKSNLSAPELLADLSVLRPGQGSGKSGSPAKPGKWSAPLKKSIHVGSCSSDSQSMGLNGDQ